MYVYLKWYSALYSLCETNFLDLFVLHEMLFSMKSTSCFAFEASGYWKLSPPSELVMLMQLACMLCFKISCSRNKNVLWCKTLCLTYTSDLQRCGVNFFLHSSHCKFWITNSITTSFYKTVFPNTSLYTVNLTFSLLEWGSVHMKPASIKLNFDLSPFIYLRQWLRRAVDSSSIISHGGLLNLLHILSWYIIILFSKSSVISMLAFKHYKQVCELFGYIITPHRQHRICVTYNTLRSSTCS